MGSQCSDFKTGVMCSHPLVLVGTRAAEFCNNCRLEMLFWEGQRAGHYNNLKNK